MSDFQLTEPTLRLPRATRPSLGNFQLLLDPELMEDLRALRTGPPNLRLSRRILMPDWSRMRAEDLNRALRTPPATTSGLGAIPCPTPTPEDMDAATAALTAFTRTPFYQGTAGVWLGNLARDLGRQYNSLSTGEQVLLITHSAVIAGGLIAAINLSSEPPGPPLDLILNREFEFPDFWGATFELRHHGASFGMGNIADTGLGLNLAGDAVDGQFEGSVEASLNNILDTGLSATAGLGLENGNRNMTVMIRWDATQAFSILGGDCD
ncbi:MAG: hypothetical protein AAGH68_05340 [Pseudomonadota bacterium]